MGPRFFNRGNLLDRATPRRDAAEPSMGPRFFNRGNVLPRRGAATPLRPSMGPRFFNRGNMPALFDGDGNPIVLQWGRGFSTAEITVCGSMPSSIPALQWGRGFSTAEMCGLFSCCGFRSRPSMGPRFFNRGNITEHGRRNAPIRPSMGPRFFNRGNSPRASSIPCGATTFNGAAVFQPRKSVTAPSKGSPRSIPLQWGRGFSTAEITRFLDRHKLALTPFNGAAVFQPRKYASVPLCVISLLALQWGRGFSTAEMTNH